MRHKLRTNSLNAQPMEHSFVTKTSQLELPPISPADESYKRRGLRTPSQERAHIIKLIGEDAFQDLKEGGYAIVREDAMLAIASTYVSHPNEPEPSCIDKMLVSLARALPTEAQNISRLYDTSSNSIEYRLQVVFFLPSFKLDEKHTKGAN
jgi:hypothetical protein